MIYRLDTAAENYVPELGDGFDASRAGNPEGLQVADYYAEADGPGVYYISYRVEVKEDVNELFVFAGRKQLLRHGSRKAGEMVEGTVYLHFGQIIPASSGTAEKVERIGFAVACEDQGKLGRVEMAAEKLSDSTKIPVIYLGGDSTVTDQVCEEPYVPGGCYSSWGQNLAYFLGGSAAVDNQAESGLTTESFREQGYYRIVTDQIRPGDLCMFQFAHNDQKLPHLQAQTGYRENLIRFVNEIRSYSGVPVLVTPLARNLWNPDGTYNDLLKEHSQAVFDVGEETGAPVIDLHGFSVELIRKNGKENSRVYYHPGDMTHTNEYGSWLFARFIARELSRLDPTGFPVEPGDETELLPDEKAGIMTGARVDLSHTKQQREAFDTMEKAGDGLLEAVKKAREEAGLN